MRRPARAARAHAEPELLTIAADLLPPPERYTMPDQRPFFKGNTTSNRGT